MNKTNISVSISKDQLAELPVVSFPGRITVVDTVEEAKSAIKYLRRQKIVGVDTETRPSFRKGMVNTVALIQISSRRHCFLFRLKKIGFCAAIKRFFEDERIIKVGLSLHDDMRVLHRVAEFEPAGLVELQQLVREYSINDISLQKIYAILFDERISKGQRLSNWEADELSDSQQHYAAIDAWACLRIYDYLVGGCFDPVKSKYIVLPEPEDDVTPECGGVTK